MQAFIFLLDERIKNKNDTGGGGREKEKKILFINDSCFNQPSHCVSSRSFFFREGGSTEKNSNTSSKNEKVFAEFRQTSGRAAEGFFFIFTDSRFLNPKFHTDTLKNTLEYH